MSQPMRRLGGKRSGRHHQKLGALDSLSVDPAKERSKNGGVIAAGGVVEDEGASRAGGGAATNFDLSKMRPKVENRPFEPTCPGHGSGSGLGEYRSVWLFLELVGIRHGHVQHRQSSPARRIDGIR